MSTYQKIDIGLRITTGLIGFFIMTLLAYLSYEVDLDSNQAMQHALEINIWQVAAPHLVLLDECGIEGEQARSMIADLTEYISRFGDNDFRNFAAYLLEKSQDSPCAYDNNAALRIVESRPNINDGSVWYVVLASYSINRAKSARDRQAELINDIASRFPDQEVRLYTTGKTNFITLTLGGPRQELEANKIAGQARNSGIGDTAYAQYGQDWTLYHPR